jgi:hypothetical protein
MAPIIYAIQEFIVNGSIDIVELFPVFILFGLVFSIPCFFIYYFIFIRLSKTNLSPILIKLILNTLAVMGIIVSWKIMEGSMADQLTIIYSIAVIVSSLFYRIRSNKQGRGELLSGRPGT